MGNFPVDMLKSCLISAMVSFGVCAVFCKLLIPVLKKWKAGQNILSYVKEHKGKSGTPTMGGLAFVLSAVLVSLIFIRRLRGEAVVCITMGLAYLLVGLIDDLMKMRRKQNLGLRAYQKLIFQLCVAVFAGVFYYRSVGGNTVLPFTDICLRLGVWIVPFVALVFIATVNCVNLTDGLDGLAAGCSTPYFLALGGMILIKGGQNGLETICFCLVGALLAYLLFNCPPASVFMGDTGSLALGGFAASLACFSGNALYIPVLGAAFVLSGITVIVQVIYYKASRGKRVFLMAPVHHHFQMKGYAESKISFAYAAISLILGALCVIFAL